MVPSPTAGEERERALSATFVNFYPMRFRNISEALKFGFLRSEKKKGYKSSPGNEVKLQGKAEMITLDNMQDGNSTWLRSVVQRGNLELVHYTRGRRQIMGEGEGSNHSQSFFGAKLALPTQGLLRENLSPPFSFCLA